ncbi:sugar kinase [Edwardsiella ictaluri]|uniref:Sugar kinase n=1 Tax=Edwardsiella ictaluri TaxID=67780 RepID=A0ABY8GJQ4_EDWIC|nr:sugar kinase [Edwardsiella ictaluri]ELV7527593.1 sugar kinase [Edwardsiella ictaluri]KMQ78624.1 ketodeoxygluconokinase [Edwardsiella ictaluri]KOO56286.1 ketodeoxygluconokinase [Edwardsiella ictaluri]WFN97568.1 sugar kinase [Edwardsiella ictaluri]
MTSANIAIIGECMIELSQKGADLTRGFGGDTLNTAVYLARQVPAERLSVHYVTALGCDSFSGEMIDSWQQEGLQTALVQRMNDKLPGLYVIETDTYGERTFYYWRNDAAARYWLQSIEADAICDRLAQFDYLYLSGISLAILDDASRERLMLLLQRCRDNGGKIIFDNNYRPRLWQGIEQARNAYRAILSCTDIAFLTLDDEDLLWGQQPLDAVLERTHALGVSEVIIKRGADACLVSIGTRRDEIPAVRLAKEQVIDTTAAGDSFSAGYLSVRLMGGDVQTAAARGHLTASTVIQHRGAIIPRDVMPA